MPKQDYEEQKQNDQQSVNTQTWQDSTTSKDESKDKGKDKDKDAGQNIQKQAVSETIPQLTADEQKAQDEKRNSPEFEQGLKDILPQNDAPKEKTPNLNLDQVIKQWQSENKNEEEKDTKENTTGLPDDLKTKMETLSGIALDDVKVHYNSALPKKYNALAYTQGTEIHVGAGQKQYLAHELWHVVQQKQGKVKPTTQVKGEPVNDDVSLEKEADKMGDKAMNMPQKNAPQNEQKEVPLNSDTMQGYWADTDHPGVKISENNKFGVVDKKFVWATKEAIDESNSALQSVGALVRLVPEGSPSIIVDDVSWYRVDISASGPQVKQNSKWGRIQGKEGVDGSFKTFADCFRTSGVVSGMNPDDLKSEDNLKLTLKTGQVPVMTNLQAVGYNVTKSMGARCAASFFLAAMPLYSQRLDILKNTDDDYTDLAAAVKSKLSGVASSPGIGGPAVYKLILAHEKAKADFCDYFGVNGGMAPEVGTALVQVGDETERASAVEDKWNYHWAGVVLKDGTDYLTLENLAMELNEFSQVENELNADILGKKFIQKNDMINERWYFQSYGKDAQSFHDKNLDDPHATPSGISLPVHR